MRATGMVSAELLEKNVQQTPQLLAALTSYKSCTK